MFRLLDLWAGCAITGFGDAAGLYWRGPSLLYRFADATVDETAVLGAGGSVTRLTSILRALPRNVPTQPASVYWEADFSTEQSRGSVTRPI